MNLIKIICTGFLALVFSGLSAQENPLWMRYPAISPDGKTIAFCYKGDIFLVSSEGGRATQLTTHPAYDSRPCLVTGRKNHRFHFCPGTEG